MLPSPSTPTATGRIPLHALRKTHRTTSANLGNKTRKEEIKRRHERLTREPFECSVVLQLREKRCPPKRIPTSPQESSFRRSGRETERKNCVHATQRQQKLRRSALRNFG